MNSNKLVCDFSDSIVTPEGVPEVSPLELNKHLGSTHIIDVRRPDEFSGELAHVPGSQLVTLETDFMNFLQNVPAEKKDESFVFVCRSGARSARATLFAQQSGFSRVYNMTGGMIYWNELRLPTEK